MDNESEINIFMALNFIRDNAPAYAKAKAERIYLEEFRKTRKALLMQQGQAKGINASNAQETYAYAHPEYVEHLEALRTAVETEEKFRWLFVAAEAKIEAWRTIQANQRLEARTV